MSNGNGNTGLLAIIVVVLIAIAGFLVYQESQESPAEKVAESVGRAADDIGDAVSGN